MTHCAHQRAYLRDTATNGDDDVAYRGGVRGAAFDTNGVR